MSIKKHILFLFIEVLIFLFSVQLFSQNIAWKFPVEIKFASALGFFDKTDINGTSERAKAKIESNDKLRIAFNLALVTYEINKGNINANGIKTALNTLSENIRNGSKKITITFAFDKGTIEKPGYYKYYQKKFGYGRMKFSNMKKNLDVHGGTEDCDKKITIYNGIEDFSWKNYKATKDGCSYETVIRDLDYKEGKTLAPPWQPSSIKTYSIAGAIFHELVHIALNCYGNSNVKTRYKDEATVNEVMLKIFPHGTGFNVYEMSYFLQLMNYKNGREKDKAFKFKEDKISRIFNPPYYGVYKNLIYKEVDKKIKVIKHGVTKITKSPVSH